MPIRKFDPADVASLTEIVRATGVFREEEVDVAVELMNAVKDDPSQKDYTIFTEADDGGTVRGYYCVGPTPLTKSTFDLYWIAVDPGAQRKGIGQALLNHCETYVRDAGGRLIMVETSSLPRYDATRKFYARNAYVENARIRDYYSPGDDLVVYSKHIEEG